jgi:hypothetical protein
VLVLKIPYELIFNDGTGNHCPIKLTLSLSEQGRGK